MIRRPPRSTLFPYTTLFRSKIDYPDPILNRRLSVEDCVKAAEECGAPVVTIPGGEPLLHKEIGTIVAELVKRRFFVILCTNALLLEKKLHLFKPSPYFTLSVHLDGLKDEHDKAVSQKGVFDRAVSAIKASQEAGDRKSTRLNSSHANISYAVFCLKKKKNIEC